MRIIFFGATDLTLALLKVAIARQYEIVGIVTLKKEFRISYASNKIFNTRDVDLIKWSDERKIPNHLYQDVASLNIFLDAVNAEIAIVAGWYHFIPSHIRNFFPLGCYGFHASLLPELRGGAPLNWAIILGLKSTGVSFFQLSEIMDDGLLLAQQSFDIEKDDYIFDLILKAEHAAVSIFEKILPKIAKRDVKLSEQSGQISYAGQRRPSDSKINWNDTAARIYNLVRASSYPYAGAYTFLLGKKVIIWKAKNVKHISLAGSVGQIFVINKNANPFITTGNGVLEIEECTTMSGENGIPFLVSNNQNRFV